MNQTHFEHIGYALLIQVVIASLTYDWWIGAAAGAFFFIGREHAQAERRSGNEFKAFDPRYWSLDSVLDFVCPTVAVVVVAMFAQVY